MMYTSWLQHGSNGLRGHEAFEVSRIGGCTNQAMYMAMWASISGAAKPCSEVMAELKEIRLDCLSWEEMAAVGIDNLVRKAAYSDEQFANPPN